MKHVARALLCALAFGAVVTAAEAPPALAADSRAVAVGDINGDAFVDLVFANSGTSTVLVNTGSGGTFAAGAGVGPHDARDVALVDLLGDTLPELVLADGAGGAAVYRNTGGTFTLETTLATGPTSAVSAGDFNGDQRTDLVFARDTATPPAVPSALVMLNPSGGGPLFVSDELGAAAATGVRSHILHLSAAAALPQLRAARAEGVLVTAETCPHYLAFASEDIPDGATEYKCAPPIRSSEHRDALWRALDEGVLDLIASDHSPSPPELKCLDTGDFSAAWGGIVSLQFLLPAVWTEASKRGHSPQRLASWLSQQPANLVGLSDQKGRIAAGCDADLVVWDPDATYEVTEYRVHHRHKLTPYLGRRMRGRIAATFLRGELIAQDGIAIQSRSGTILLRKS